MLIYLNIFSLFIFPTYLYSFRGKKNTKIKIYVERFTALHSTKKKQQKPPTQQQKKYTVISMEILCIFIPKNL